MHIEHNSFDDIASSLYMTGYSGETSDFVFERNFTQRLRGPMPRGQMVQFNHVRGPGNKVLCNVDDESTPGNLAGPEDHVSVFDSAGTAASPLTISFNKIRGGGPSRSGGGIIAGDFGSAYIEITDNILLSPGQYGLAIAGGEHGGFLRNHLCSQRIRLEQHRDSRMAPITPGTPGIAAPSPLGKPTTFGATPPSQTRSGTNRFRSAAKAPAA